MQNADKKTPTCTKIKSVLVTGGAGFIGSHVCFELISLGHNVVVLDDLSGGYKGNVPEKSTFYKGSILDELLIERLFIKYQFEFVIHTAAYAAEGLSHFIRKFNYTNNIIGSINLINAAIKHKSKRFIFTSSIAVYGTQQTPFLETTIPNPEDPYGIAKYSIEQDLKAAHEQFGLRYTILRPHNVYGIRQNLTDPYRNVVAIFIKQILNKSPLPIFGNGEQVRSFTSIDSIAPAIANCITNKSTINEIINLGNNSFITVLELATKLSKIANIEPQINFLPQRNETFEAISNHEKAKRIFPDIKDIPIDLGLDKMWNWAKILELSKKNQKVNIELSEGLPAYWK